MADSKQASDVLVTMDDIRRGQLGATAAEIRRAIRGTGGYTTFWPRRRRGRRRAGQRRHRGPASITRFRVAVRRPSTIRVSHLQRHGTLLELRRTIRGYRNVHYQAARRTIEHNWSAITAAAAADAGRRAAASARSRERRERAARRQGATP